MMDIYAKGTVGQAWQYAGDADSMPSWVRSSPKHHVEVGKSGLVYLWRGNECIRIDNGDWVVSFQNGGVGLYDNNAFKLNFTFTDPARHEIESVASEKYRSKPKPIRAWQYSGELHVSELPGWVIDLILHHKLGYHSVFNSMTNSDTELFELYYEDVWVPLIKSDWLVRYNEDSFGIVSDNDFKEYFEEIK